MNTLSYTEIPHAEASDIGKIAIMEEGCNPLAIEDTLDACVETCRRCGIETVDEQGEGRPMTIADAEAIAHIITS